MKNKLQGKKTSNNSDLVVCNNYRLVKKLGTGAFG